MEENRYLYGLDLSLSSTGVTVYDLVDKKFIFIGTISTDKIKKNKKNSHLYLNALKLSHIEICLKALMEKYPPREIAIERGFSRFNAATQAIFRVHGIVNLIFKNIPQIYYPPKDVKATIYKGTATKTQLQTLIKNKYPHVEFANEDESDSFAIALTYLMKNGLIEYFPERVLPKKKTTKKTK